MSRFLRELLGIDLVDYERTIKRLEHVTAGSSTDVRLTAEIITKVREKIRAIGLDPEDSTILEVQQALVGRALEHDYLLRRKMSIKEGLSPSKCQAKLQANIQPLLNKDRVVSIHATGIRAVLKSVPPKRTLKLLKLRSIDAVLKRENPFVLYAVAKNIEPKTWQRQIEARLKRLKSNQVGEMVPQILMIPDAWVGKMERDDRVHVVQVVPEIGSILLQPSVPLSAKGAVLLASVIVLQSVNKLVIESLPYRRRGMIVGHHTVLSDVLAETDTNIVSIAGISPSWGVLYQMLAEQSKSQMPDTEFVLSELEWESTEMKLASLCPAMDYWVDSHYLGIKNNDTTPVSFHVADIAATAVLRRPFGEHIVSHMRESLWNEIVLRYMKHHNLEKTSYYSASKG